MAKLSNYRRIYKNDFPEESRPIIEKLSVTVNQSFDEIYQALNRNLTFADNITSTIATVNVSISSDGTPSTKTSFKLSSTQKNVNGIIALSASGPKFPIAGIFISFTNDSGIITINNIQGLSPGSTYSLTLLCI